MASDGFDIVIGAEDRATAVLNRVQSTVSGFGANLAALGPTAIGIGAAVAGAAGAFFTLSASASAISAASERLDALADVAFGLGESVGSIQEFQFAMAEAGNVDPEKSIIALQKLQRVIGDIATGGTAGADVFKQLGLDAEQLAMEGPIAQFEAIKAALSQIENRSERAALAQQLFGKAAAELMPALMAESDSLRESMEYARSVNAAVGDDGASAVAMMNDAIGRVSLGFEGMWNTVAIELAPAVEMVATAITGWLPSIVDLVETYLPAAIDGFVFMADSIYEAAEIIGLAAKREETFAQAIERTRQAAQDRAAEMEADRLANKEASKWAAEQEAAKKAADAEAKQREKEAKDLEAANKKKEDQAKAEQTRIDNLIKREEDRLKIRELELTQGKEAARVWDLTNQGVDEATAKRLVAQENSLARGNISQQINAATQGRLITRGTSDLMPKLVALAEKQTKAAENSEKSLADIYEEQKRNKPTQNVASGV